MPKIEGKSKKKISRLLLPFLVPSIILRYFVVGLRSSYLGLVLLRSFTPGGIFNYCMQIF